MKDTKQKFANAGFTVLYAMLIAALLLSIGLSIYNILIKDLVLSSEESNSQGAFFAADSGLECALYWDQKGGIFATSTASQTFNGTADCGPIPTNIVTAGYPTGYTCPSGYTCPNPGWAYEETANSATTTFTVYYSASTPTTGSCAIVSVGKVTNGSTQGTDIQALGYNTCDVTNPTRVERGFEVSY